MQVSRIGRFEQSFMFHMIRDFFLLLLVVVGAELGIRYGVVLYDFRQNEPTRVDRSAQQLAADIKSIMLNSGGPTAAQTVYPILNRNYDDLGLSIAVLPSDVTVASMKSARNMDAQGLPSRWPAGQHNEASVQVKAEQFCIGCHVLARVGDVLGTVTVRSYLSRKEAAWWHDVRLTAGLLSFNIIVHTIVLFLLLKVRMEPLLSLRSTVSGLAKGVMDLSPRTAVKSDDEFGELALDLNHFLDRIELVVHDLDKILSEVVTVGERLGALNGQLEVQFDGLRDAALGTLADNAQRGQGLQLAAAREAGAFDVMLRTVDELAGNDAPPGPWRAPVQAQLARLRERCDALLQLVLQAAPAAAHAQEQSAQHHAFAQSLREMALLEATMHTVAESGQRVLRVLSRGRPR